MNPYQESTIVCPHCRHRFTNDEMQDGSLDPWEAAREEEIYSEVCPSCDAAFFVKGGYTTHWTTDTEEEHL